MRHELAVTLVVCGTLLALAPPLYDYFAGRAQASAMLEVVKAVASQSDAKIQTTVWPQLSSDYRFGCWMLGAMTIAIGVIGGWRRASYHHAEYDAPYPSTEGASR